MLAQSEFNDVNVEYTFSLPSDNWKMTVKPSRMSPNVEYVYNYRKEGHLEIRKITIDPNTLFGDLIRDEEQKLQFVPGYVAGREENFKGLLEGSCYLLGRTASAVAYDDEPDRLQALDGFSAPDGENCKAC